jgi:response regulator RpfG family c-di-GMP phosphodiesterase
MDVSMPDVDGFELADLIRSHPRFQKTAIVFISGVHLTDSDKIQAYRSGAVDYISVPVVPEVLRAKIAVFVELHRKTRMLERLNSELEQRVEERTDELRQSEMEFRTRARDRGHHGARLERLNPILECRSRNSLRISARGSDRSQDAPSARNGVSVFA